MVIVYVRGGGSTQATTDAVVQRASTATAKLADSIGPNTTFHSVGISHNNHPVATDAFALPADTKTELWVAFGADGAVSGYYEVTTDLAGQVYQTTTFTPPATMIITDIATGKTITQGQGSAGSPDAASTLASRLALRDSTLLAAVAASGEPAPTARNAAGNDTYVVMSGNTRVYLDKSSYNVTQMDEIADDGSVTRTSSIAVFEVLAGDSVPSVTPIAGLTTTPFFPAAPAVASVPPAGIEVILECEVQPTCIFSGETTGIDVDVVLRNNASDTTIAAFNFDVWNQSKALLNPSTPARNVTFLSDAGWNCTLPAPNADTFSGAPGTSTSRLGCINSAGNNAVPSGDSIIATVHFAVAGESVSSLLLSNVAVADANATSLVTCSPDYPPPATPSGAGLAGCSGVIVQITP